jgi:glycine oxidase
MTSAVIIGGGVIGLSVAWRAAQRGISVTLADPQPGRGASHAAAGMLTPAAEAAYAEKDLFTLGLESLERYPGFVEELTARTGEPTGFRQAGTLQVGYDADDLAVLHEAEALQESLGVASERLTARECRAAEPMLDPSVRGGLLTKSDGSVDPRLLIRVLAMAAGQAGVTVLPQQAAEILVSTGPGPGERAAGIRLADGTEVTADHVVLAAGWQSGQLRGLPPGALPPIRPVKGQILRLRASGGAALPGRCVRGIVRGCPVYLLPRESGELVVGATQEELGADTRVTAGGVWALLRDARTLVPGITELDFTEAIAGLRPCTPDNAPVLGPAGLPGLVLATGHFRGGVLLSPITAEVIAEYLATERMPAVAAPFTMARFATAGGIPRVGIPRVSMAGAGTPGGGMPEGGGHASTEGRQR